MQKIVRDRIPEIIEASGRHAEYERVSADEALGWLEQKLDEELAEYHESRDIEELADLIEVVRGILSYRGVEWDELERIRLDKRAERGGFADGIVLTL